VGRGVEVGEAVAVGGGGKIWLTTVCPNAAETIENDMRTKATMSHCQPVAI